MRAASSSRRADRRLRRRRSVAVGATVRQSSSATTSTRRRCARTSSTRGTHPPAVRVSADARRIGSNAGTPKIDRGRCRCDSFATAGCSRSMPADAPWFPLGTDALGRDQLARLASGRAALARRGARRGARRARSSARSSGASPASLGGAADDGADARGRLRHRAAGALRRARAARGDAARAHAVAGVLDDGRRAGGGGLAVPGARRAGGRGLGAHARVRRSCAGSWAPAVRGYCYVTCCRRRAAFSSCSRRCCVPAFVLAEATLSFVGLGFGEPISSWGAMLRDAGGGRAVRRGPVAPRARRGDRGSRARGEPRSQRAIPHAHRARTLGATASKRLIQ